MSDSCKGAGSTPWGLDGTGQDRTGPDGTVRDGPVQDRLPGENGLRSVSGSGLAGGQSVASATPSGFSDPGNLPITAEAGNLIADMLAARVAENEVLERYNQNRLTAKGYTLRQIEG
ncbi:MAG: hypothetical protein ACPGVG_13095, partial [Mycobacterium sp.]